MPETACPSPFDPGPAASGSAARAVVVSRTRRVVREQALTLRERRQRSRSLWAPIAICSSLLLVVISTIWSMLDEYEVTQVGVPDAGGQLFVLLLWSLPVTAAMIGIVWLRRGRQRSHGEASR